MQLGIDFNPNVFRMCKVPMKYHMLHTWIQLVIYALMPILTCSSAYSNFKKEDDGKNLVNPLVISMWFTRCICNVTVCTDSCKLARNDLISFRLWSFSCPGHVFSSGTARYASVVALLCWLGLPAQTHAGQLKKKHMWSTWWYIIADNFNKNSNSFGLC